MLALAVVTTVGVAQAEHCPRRFDQQTTGLPTACVFVGTFNAHCGGNAMVLFAGDGTALVLSIAAPLAAAPLFLPAQVLSATEGKLVSWHRNLQLAAARSAGTVRLEDGGARLRIQVAGGDLIAGDCRFEEYVGRFVGMAGRDPRPREPDFVARLAGEEAMIGVDRRPCSNGGAGD